MPEKTLAEEIITIIQATSNNNPAPTRCTIKKIHDTTHTDVQTSTGIIEYVETIANNLAIGNPGILISLDGDENNLIVITK